MGNAKRTEATAGVRYLVLFCFMLCIYLKMYGRVLIRRAFANRTTMDIKRSEIVVSKFHLLGVFIILYLIFNIHAK